MDTGKANWQTSHDVIHYVRERWYRLVQKYAHDPQLLDTLFAEIQTAYNSPKRRYHNLEHIHELLLLSDGYRHYLNEIDIVDFAIFYHDFVYSALRSDNEEKSAIKASKKLGSINLSTEKITIVADYINASKKHELGKRNNESDLAWFLDFDMAILGSDPERYHRYSQNVRLEFQLYPDIIYNPGRKKFLRDTLLKPSIYHTAEFRAVYEQQARINLQSELAKLESI